MEQAHKGWTDQQVEQFVGNLLRTGVFTAAAVVLFGGMLYLWEYGITTPEYEKFKGEPAQLRDIGEIVKDVLIFDGKAVIQFGLVLLLATPVARVVFSVVAFALQRDRLYVVITLIVLAVLVFSLVGGIGRGS